MSSQTELLEKILLRFESLEAEVKEVLARSGEQNKETVSEPITVQWTHSKTDLIELIYALHASGAFNKGKATIREITLFFEEAFSLKLGNTSMTFQEILRRKDSTAFLEKLKDKLELHITRLDEKNFH